MAPEYASNLFSLRILLIYFQTITLGRSNVEQHCFSVVTLSNIELRLFQHPVFAGYLYERPYRPVYEHRVPNIKGILLQWIHLKIPKQFMKVTSWKMLFLNCVNINI